MNDNKNYLLFQPDLHVQERRNCSNGLRTWWCEARIALALILQCSQHKDLSNLSTISGKPRWHRLNALVSRA